MGNVSTEEYKKYFPADYANHPIFAGTEEKFEIGDFVEVDGKRYELVNFFRSVHAADNVIDWLRLQRTNSYGVVIWRDCYPSEVSLKSRPVT